MTHTLLVSLAFGLCYAAAAALAHVLSVHASDVSTFWVPSGLYLAVLLRTRRAQWPAMAAAGMIANVGFEVLAIDRSMAVAMGFATANTVEALVGAAVLRWSPWVEAPVSVDLARVSVLLRFFATVLAATVVGAAIGASVVTATYGGSPIHNGITWWVSDAVAVLVVTPALLMTAAGWRQLRQSFAASFVESAAGIAVLLALSAYLFWFSTAGAAWTYLLLPSALWLTLRLRVPGVAVGMAVFSAVAVLGTNSGRGVFAGAEDPAAMVTVLQGFLSVVTICLLSLAAAVTQSHEAAQQLDAMNRSLAAEAARLSAAATTTATRLRLALQGAEMGTWQWTVGTSEATLDDRQRAILGLEPDEPIRSSTIFARIHPDDLHTLRGAVARWAEAGGLWEYEHRVFDRSGAVRWVAGRAALLTGASGERLATGVTWDVTRQQVAEDALRESDERFRQLADHLDAGLWIYDVALARVRYASSGFLRTWRVDPRQLMDDPDFWGSLKDSDDRRLGRHAFQDFLAGDRDYLVDYRITLPSGAVRWVQDRAFVVARDASGAARVVAGLSIDVTERRETEQALRESDRQKDAFLAMLAHELRNPLAPIRTATHMLSQPAGDAAHARALAVIDRQVTHIVRLVDDLVDISRLSRGRLVLQQAPVDLCDIVRDTVDDYAGVMETVGIHVDLQLPESPVFTWGDRTRLAQVLGNLLHNARKFTPPGGRVDIVLSAAEPGGLATLRVADSGSGIDPAVLPHVFEAFSQAPQALDRSSGGLGLGLSLVRGLVELHGGQATAHSDGPGRGALFAITLPVVPAPAVQPQAGDIAAELPRVRVLVVEDNADAAVVMRLWLESLGHSVMVADNGTDALAVVASESPDLVLCDIGLPGPLSGLDVARLIRERHPRRPLLATLTGYAGEGHMRDADAAGFDRHLAKPVSPEALQDVLREAGQRAASSAS